MYIERQGFTKLWIWVLLFALLAGSLYFIFWEGEQTLSNFIGLAILLLVMSLMYILRLFVSISPDGIRYAFFPFVKEHLMPWSTINSVKLVKYSPLRDFGGWGFRFNPITKMRAYNTSGNIGIIINGNFLLGITKPEALKKFLLENPEFAAKIQVEI